MLKVSKDKYRPSGDQSTTDASEISGPRVSSVSSAPDPSDGLRTMLDLPGVSTPYAMYFPSGDHTLHPRQSGPNVIRRPTPPATGSDHKSVASGCCRSPSINSNCLPSGEIFGER